MNKPIIWTILLIFILGCGAVKIVPASQPPPPAEIPEATPPPAGETVQTPPPATPAPATPAAATPAAAPPVAATAALTATTVPPPPTAVFLQGLSTGSADDPEALPRHGLIIALVLPLLLIAVPWTILEYFVVRYVQPRGIDLSSVRIKAKDGMFIEATLSLTARRMLSLASTRMTWVRVKNFVEKLLEQELIHQALEYPTLDELEPNLKTISEQFMQLPILQELKEDFGVEVVRFNIEAKYPQETMDALNRKAEASAGGSAYLAYARAARLNPDSQECRELYRIYQQTSGRVDAARNLGGGIASLAKVLSPERKRDLPDD